MKTTKTLCAALAAFALTPFLRAADVYVVASANANAANGDWRLRRNSDFYKKGVVQNWMLSATDFAGGPRVTKAGLVDLGCFETPYVPSATIILLF